MGNYKEIEGNLITLGLQGEFDVIVHGCNCFCTMGAGIAPQMASVFACDKYYLENSGYHGDFNKMGQIASGTFYTKTNEAPLVYSVDKINDRLLKDGWRMHHAVNCYTQYGYGKHKATGTPDLDYEALTLCLRKINAKFRIQSIGLPQIGCGLAGGDWEKVREIIQKELRDCDVTVVIYKLIQDVSNN